MPIPRPRVAVVRGPGDAFAAGGDINMVEVFGKDWEKMAGGWKEARDIVYNIINCSKTGRLRDQGWCGGRRARRRTAGGTSAQAGAEAAA